jgi:hypothetical protein
MIISSKIQRPGRGAISLMAAVLVLVALGSCDVDVFGTTWKQIAAGYQLVESEIPHACGVVPPGQKFGSLATEIGWRKPYIIFRESDSKPWTVIDTRTGLETSVSDDERTRNPAYAEMPIYTADIAWRRLSRHRRQW